MKNEHRMNCIKLMLGVHDWPWESKLMMLIFCMNEPRDRPLKKDDYGCRSSACFLGHGPAAGIHKPWLMDWEEYACRKFGIEAKTKHKLKTWSFVFSPSWSNSKSQRVARMHRYLTKGGPKRFQYDSRYRKPTPVQIKAYRAELKVLEAKQ